MRLFIASRFSDRFLDQLSARGSALAALYPPKSLRLVRRENLHLTYQFLGEIPGSSLRQIEEALSTSLEGFSSFIFQPGEIGVFPNKFRPRVMWIGLSPAAAFLSIAKAVNSALADLVEPDSKKFKPHITLARFNEKHAAFGSFEPSETLLPAFQLREADCLVDSVSLFQSELRPAGPDYTELCRISLRKYAKLL